MQSSTKFEHQEDITDIFIEENIDNIDYLEIRHFIKRVQN